MELPGVGAPGTAAPTTETQPSPTNSITMRKERRRKLIVPKIGSLYDILHDHAGVSLYVPPIFWTDMHTHLLQSRFVMRPRIRWPPHPSPYPSPPSPQSPRRVLDVPETMIRVNRHLDTLMSPATSFSNKTYAMEALLPLLYPNSLSSASSIRRSLSMRFGHKFYREATHYQSLWSRSDPNSTPGSANASTSTAPLADTDTESDGSAASPASGTPTHRPSLLAYINYKQLRLLRNSCYRVPNGTDGNPNRPVMHLKRLRAKKMVPRNYEEDAYILASMLSMAQQSVYADISRGTGFVARDVETHLLTMAENEHAFIVYSATIPAAVLSMFDKPDIAPPSDPEIKVEYCRVAAWPVLGLKERLGKALGPNLVGHIDDETMESWGYCEPAAEAPLKKRRREVVEAALNTSLTEDLESDSAGDMDEPYVKRQCRGNARLGMVQ
ncbi:hypothetical protein GGS20DRAFT_563986 [Poronia punctata]|nr:hypothetical protein GGS20DRAFT_563986 [Poronia punctata]